jgi:hypothetical protein
MQGVAANEALVVPHGHKAAISTLGSLRKPVGILAALTAAIDKRACEDIVVLHSTIPAVQGTDAPKFTGKSGYPVIRRRSF